MKASKLAVGGIVGGLILGGLGLLQRPDAPSPAPAPTVMSVADVETVHGLAPLERVVDLWQTRSEQHPTDYISRTSWGSALAGQARENADLVGYETAEEVLREALELNPIYERAQLTLASVLHAQHRFAEARGIAATIADSDPTSLGALLLRGDADFELGNYIAARDAYERVAQAERSAAILSRQARVAAVLGQNDEAVELAEAALALSQQFALRPSSAAFYWFQLGHFQFESGDADGAIGSLESALEIAPDNPGATERLANVYAASGEYDAARELYERLIDGGGAADIHGSYADLLLVLGEPELAAEHEQIGLDLVAATIDRFPSERRHLAGFLMRRDPILALQLAEADIAERQDVGAYDTLAWALFHNERYAEAAIASEQALAQGTGSPSVLARAGVIAAANGDRSVAADLLEQAIEINPHFSLVEAPQAMALLAQLRAG